MAKSFPSYDQFPGDYTMEIISSLSLEAQGLWYRLEMIMHTTERYGYLQLAGKPMPDILVARRIGIDVTEYLRVLKELDDAHWLQREPRTHIIFSPALVRQEEMRARNARYQTKHRRGQTAAEQEALSGAPSSSLELRFEDSTSILEDSIGDQPNSQVPRKPLNGIENSKTEVREITDAPNGKGKGKGKGTPPVVVLPSPKELEIPGAEVPRWDQQSRVGPPMSASELAKAQVSQFGRELHPDQPLDELVEEIVLASPAAAAHGWTALSIHGNSRLVYPAHDAVTLEAKEQGIDARSAAVWLLRQVREITQAVMAEPGWERFWTANRMAKFFADVEYRNVGRFKRVGAQRGTANGTRASKTDGNAEVVRAALAAADGGTSGRGASEGDRPIADSSGIDAGPTTDDANGPGLRGSSRGADTGAVHPGVQSGTGDVQVLPNPRRTANPGWSRGL